MTFYADLAGFVVFLLVGGMVSVSVLCAAYSAAMALWDDWVRDRWRGRRDRKRGEK